MTYVRQDVTQLREQALEARQRSDRLAGQIANPANLASEKRNLMRSAEQAAAMADDLDRQADRAEALVSARELIRPVPEAENRGDGRWEATARGQFRSETTYRPDVRGTSYIHDLLVISQPGSHDPRSLHEASERLRRNQDEASAFLGLTRDVTTGDPGAGSFIPPVYMDKAWIDAAVAGRPLADAVAQFPYSPQGKTISFPRVQAAPETAVQVAEADAVHEQDLDSDTLDVAKVTVAGQNDTSIQSFDWSLPGVDTIIIRELRKSYNQKLDYGLLYGTGANGQHRGLKTVVTSDGGIAISFSAGGADDLLGKIYDAISQVSTLAPGYVANAVVLHPRRAAWMGSHRDALQNLLQQGQLPVAAGTQDNGQAGTVAGLRVIIDPNIATNQGTGTNEDDVYVVASEELMLAESPLQTRVLHEVLSGTLQVRIQAFGYSAFASSRRPKIVARISGAGLATPTFPST